MGGLTFIIIVGDAHSVCRYVVVFGECVSADELKISHTFYGVNMHKINENSLHNSTHTHATDILYL